MAAQADGITGMNAPGNWQKGLNKIKNAKSSVENHIS